MKIIATRTTLGTGKEVLTFTDGRVIRAADHDNDATSLLRALTAVSGGVDLAARQRGFGVMGNRTFCRHRNGWWVTVEIHSPLAIIAE